MTDSKHRRGGIPNVPPPGESGERNAGQEFGARDAATRGTNRDADRSGQSKNQGHGHPREERGTHRD